MWLWCTAALQHVGDGRSFKSWNMLNVTSTTRHYPGLLAGYIYGRCYRVLQHRLIYQGDSMSE
jgi:hypothetical protein